MKKLLVWFKLLVDWLELLVGKLLCRVGIHDWTEDYYGDEKGNSGGYEFCKRCHKTDETCWWG